MLPEAFADFMPDRPAVRVVNINGVAHDGTSLVPVNPTLSHWSARPPPLAQVSSSPKVAARAFVPRNWSRSIPRRMSNGIGGPPKTPGPSVSARSVEALDQGEEPEATGDGAGQRIRGLIQFCDAYHCSRSTYVSCFIASTVAAAGLGQGNWKAVDRGRSDCSGGAAPPWTS